MPGHGSGTQRGAILKSAVTSSTVRYMDLGAVGKVGSTLPDDWWAEVSTEVDDGGYWQVLEVLGAENDDLPLSYEEGDLVFGLRREVAKLDTSDHGACGGCQLSDLGARGKLRQRWISVFGMFVMFEWFGQWIFAVGGPTGKVVGILDHPISRAETKEELHRLSRLESFGFLLVLPSCRADASRQVGVSYYKVASATPRELMHEGSSVELSSGHLRPSRNRPMKASAKRRYELDTATWTKHFARVYLGA